MPALNKTDEVDLLLRVLECSTQSDGWTPILALVDLKLGCTSFICEIEKNGNPTQKFGGDRSYAHLNEMLQTAKPDGGQDALRFLMTNAALYYPYCKTTLNKGEFNGNKPSLERARSRDGTPNSRPEEPEVPGLISPLKRTDHSTILFGCLFNTYTTETIDVELASETFRTLTKVLAPGLEAFFQLERERAENQIQRILLSCSSCPSVLMTGDRTVLGQTSTGLNSLLSTGGAILRGEKVDFKNKQLEACLQDALDAVYAPNTSVHTKNGTANASTQDQRNNSVCIEDPEGNLRRLIFGRVPSPVSQSGINQEPWVLIRIAETSKLPEDIEAILQDRFDLSQSEAHLARHLTMTGSMNDTVEKLGITRNTAKTHLRRIFEKTGVHTQLQLAGLIHRLSGLF
ncbi:hypothetical protein ABVF61_17720 [Roseibium sp. HPY-6]|uniref:helix-turn-helix transcriptional regulator n=1 Tax=Roseibium sp. HPY-6 TaxID=3229852 RepID=UPI00338EC097